MAVSPSNPHDAYFRHVLGRPADAASELRAALPEAVAARVDWHGLELQSGSFVSKQLRSRYSDLLFRTRLDGHDAYIYLLIEHQSCSDKFMPLRMLDYLVNIWNHYLRHNPAARTLPAVVPLVVHSNHTGRPWTAPTELSELIDLDPATRQALSPYLPRFRFLLDDIAALDLPALRARDLTPATRVMLVLHKIAPGNTRLGSDLLALTDDLRSILDGPNGTHELQCVASYILIVGDTQEADLEPLIDRLGPRAKEAIMTTAERLRAEGHAAGRAAGRAEERAELLIEQLTHKFGSLPAGTIDSIRATDPALVRTWALRVLTANTLDDVFA
ncbi:Rpn family recombination-promoting nuclease/putative transposase [Nocardia lijiangensis]|uniref:Rpn family recombination-promoting nuclease/putative transposase n=1 Tax=Nocardia lijiangensis TaxID=299618 RepID=UPI00082FD065|nr:Rpn family recombination-promoting nuclease/putative transposase [Nocardia lijiangensis]